MARLLIRGEWFDSVSPASILERDFEDLLLANAPYIYPTFHAVRFKCLVESDLGRAKADLALIDREYRSWWVVEVELSTHPLESHVVEQVAMLSSARYGRAEAEHIANQDGTLDVARLEEMMRGDRPRVLVLVNQIKPEWKLALARFEALIGVAELFRSDRSVAVLRINGEHPGARSDVLTRCVRDSVMANALHLSSPAGLALAPGQERVALWFEGSRTEWVRMASATDVWLVPVRSDPLPSGNRTFDIRRTEDDRLVLEESGPLERR